MHWNRRDFLAGAVAGTGLSSTSLPAHAGPPSLAPTLGTQRKVLVLGAGICGLVSAYELERAGFEVTVLEARHRVGGKVWTLRRGDSVEMEGRPRQTCAFADGIYFNAGAARLPSQHRRILHYCKALGVRMEAEINVSQSARFQSPRGYGGRPLEQRRATYDMRGHIAELLTQALTSGSLDEHLGSADKTQLMGYLKSFGDLDRDGRYRGSDRTGFTELPGSFGHPGTVHLPLDLDTLLAHPLLYRTQFADQIFNQPTMLQPVGGMDHIPRALAAALRRPPVLGAEVIHIESGERQARIAWRDGSGKTQALSADFVVAALPLPVLSGISNNFPAQVNAAFRAPQIVNAVKVAFDSPRFWEAEDIYGGLSFVDSAATLLWYPSGELLSSRGALVATYAMFAPGDRMHAREVEQCIQVARAAVAAVHPGKEALLENPVVVDWARVPYSKAPWLNWAGQRPAFELLNHPQGRVWFAGAHLSELDHWQEGAAASAHRVIEAIAIATAQ